MAIIKDATLIEAQQLLELFPASNLKQGWPKLLGDKTEICKEAAARRDVDVIVQFIDEHIGSCKQHIYIFTANEDTVVPANLPHCERIATTGNQHAIFLAVKEVGVIITGEGVMTKQTLKFLWPIKVQLLQGHLIVRFVTLEKNLSAHVTGTYVTEDKGITEKLVVSSIGLPSTNIHKGIRKLWDDKYMDCPRIKYIDPESTTDKAMNQLRGIRKHNPELYERVKTLEIVDAGFFTEQSPTKTSLRSFSVEPTDGYLTISRYSETKGDSDYALSEILKHNK